MSKIVGASFIVLGGTGIALALLKDTKYDPLIKLGITKPKSESEIQKSFHCEVLFQKIVSNFYSRLEVAKQINPLQFGGQNTIYGYVPNEDAKKRISELQSKYNELDKVYRDALNEYNNSVCGSNMPIGGCVNGIPNYKDLPSNPNCLSLSEIQNNDCLKLAKDYYDEYNAWKDVENDLNTLSDADFQKKYSSVATNPKGYYRDNLAKKKKEIADLKAKYEKCNISSIDCVSIKEDIDSLTAEYNNYKADPDYNRLNSPARANANHTSDKIQFLKDVYTKSKCQAKQAIRTDVNYANVRDCIMLDELIKSLKDDILFREKKKLEMGNSWTTASEIYLQKLKDRVVNEEQNFISKGCKDRLESQKLKDDAIAVTEMARIAETNVLKKNITEQYVYIGIGALITLTGFYIVLKK